MENKTPQNNNWRDKSELKDSNTKSLDTSDNTKNDLDKEWEKNTWKVVSFAQRRAINALKDL